MKVFAEEIYQYDQNYHGHQNHQCHHDHNHCHGYVDDDDHQNNIKGIIMSRKPQPTSPILNIVNVFTPTSWVDI